MANNPRPGGPWVDGVTPITAADLNRVEANTADAHARLNELGSIGDGGPPLVLDIRDYGAATVAANNATAIQAAIDAASTAGGGIVHIPAGVWMTGPLTARSFVSLRGVSEAGSVLRLVAGANAHMVTLADDNTEQVGLVDLTLDGNKAGQSSGAYDVVRFENTAYDNGRPFPSQGDPNHYAFRVAIINGKRHGLHTVGQYSASQWNTVRAYRCDGNNFHIASPDNNFVSCVSAGSGLEGFLVVGNSERLLNCKVFTSGSVTASRGVGFRVQNVARTDMIGCESQDNRSHGFSITGSYQVHLVGRADRNGLGPEPVTGYQGDGIYCENLRDSRIDIVAGDRAAGLDGNVSGGVTVMQRWAYNCGPGNDGNTVNIVSGLSASGDAGVGSWGANSLVTITHEGTILAGYGSGGQPADDDLTAIAALTPANNDVIQRKAGAWTNRTPAQVKTDLALVKGDVGLGNVDNTSDANKPVSAATQTALDGKVSTSAANVANGYPRLDASGLIPQDRLPAIALVDWLGEVSSQSAMLALTGQRGDWCTRTDLGTDWQLIADTPTQLTSWRERVYPASPVSSVNGRTGAVTGLAEASALASYVPTSRTVTAGTGLTGGGDLTANRSLAVSYGTATGTAAQGNDGRFTQVPTNAQTGTAYTLALADAGRVVEMTNAAANTVTVPPNSSVAFPVGTVIEICQTGAGATSVAAGAGVTLRTAASLAARVQWSTIALRKRGTDEWIVSGDVN